MKSFAALRIGRLFQTWTWVAVACLLVSCATIDSHTTQYAGAPHPPPTNPAAVEILRTAPARGHERIGEVKIDASVPSTGLSCGTPLSY